MKQTPVKARREFDATFKREAVQNWLNSGKSAAVIAQELGLSANLLYTWKQRFAGVVGNELAGFSVFGFRRRPPSWPARGSSAAGRVTRETALASRSASLQAINFFKIQHSPFAR